MAGATKLPESWGRISISGFSCKLCTVGASEEGRGDRTGETDRGGKAITCERSEGVQTAGPMTGDARRTSFAEGNVNEGEALNMTKVRVEGENYYFRRMLAASQSHKLV